MKDYFDKKLNFVVRHYEKGLFDTQKAIERLHERFAIRPTRKWWSVVAAAAASAAVAFAAGYGIVSIVKDAPEREVRQEAPAQIPETSAAHVFVFEDAPIADVLNELGEYYGCTLTTSPTRKHLTATFPDDNIETIVSVIESSLEIDINIDYR